jgi:hypothetical protein
VRSWYAKDHPKYVELLESMRQSGFSHDSPIIATVAGSDGIHKIVEGHHCHRAALEIPSGKYFSFVFLLLLMH